MNYLKVREKLRQGMYYIIVGIVSLITLFIMPLIGSEVHPQWSLPDTTVGWVLYISSKLAVSLLNVLIMHSFIKQGKLNIMNDERFLQANSIMNTIESKEIKWRSPKEFLAKQYLGKIPTMFISTFLGLVAFTQAVIMFDLMAFISYAVCIVIAVVFGVMTMKNNEVYWTEEFYYYALKQKEKINKEIDNDNQR